MLPAATTTTTVRVRTLPRSGTLNEQPVPSQVPQFGGGQVAQ